MSDENQAERGVGTIIREALLAHATNEEILASVQAEMPEASTTTSTVSWYRNQMRKEGQPVPTARELKKARKEAAATSAETEEPETDPLAD